MKKRFIVIILVISSLIFWACSDDSNTEPNNNAPVINSLTASSSSVTTNEEVTITCIASDDDNDTINYTWNLTGGAITGSDSLVNWIAPSTTGSYEVSCTISDGEDTDTKSIYIAVINSAPICSIMSPMENDTITIGNNLIVNVDAIDNDGTITEVRFYLDSLGIESDTNFPYSCIIDTYPYSEGFHTIKATAKDNEGAETSSQIDLFFTRNLLPIGMNYIQGGTFEMGDHFNEGYSRELPVHSVQLDDFYIGKCEITNQQYCDMLNIALSLEALSGDYFNNEEVTNAEGYSRNLLRLDHSGCQISFNGTSFVVDSGCGNYPVIYVTWYGSVFYCNIMSIDTGYTVAYDLSNWSCNWNSNGYRLPTEAEWEYAARGGLSSKRFTGGLTISHSTNADTQANYSSYWIDGTPYYNYDLSPTEGLHPDASGVYTGTLIVGSLPPNGYGQYDMCGNVWEWCWDWLDDHYYTTCNNQGTVINPTGPSNTTELRVERGGCYHENAWVNRIAFRGQSSPLNSGLELGFRVARTP